MKVSILKYYIEGLSEDHKNYFANQMGLVYDSMIFNRQLIDSFPIFREEWNEEDNVNILKTGYFDLKLSLNMTERSTEQNKSVRDFFEDCGNNIARYKYIVVCQTDTVLRTYSGVMDNTSLVFDETVTEGSYHVTLSVTGIEKEAVDYLKQWNVPRMQNDQDFESTYLPYHFYYLQPAYNPLLTLDSRLNINGTIYNNITCSKTIQNIFMDLNEFSGFSSWDGFKSFLTGFGFRFKVAFDRIEKGKAKFKLVLFWGSAGFNTVHLDRYIKYEKGLLETGDRVVMALYTSLPSTYGGRPAEKQNGFIFTRENVWLFDAADNKHIYYVPDENFYYTDTPGVNFRADAVKRLDLSLHPFRFNAPLNIDGSIAYCYIAYSKIKEVWRYIANVELGHMLFAHKLTRKLTLNVSNTDLVLHSKATIDNRSFICSRINSFDNFNNRMETEWVES